MQLPERVDVAVVGAGLAGLAAARVVQAAGRSVAVLEASDFHPGRKGRDHLRTLAVAAGIPSARIEEVLRLVELDGAADRQIGRAHV